MDTLDLLIGFVVIFCGMLYLYYSMGKDNNALFEKNKQKSDQINALSDDVKQLQRELHEVTCSLQDAEGKLAFLDEVRVNIAFSSADMTEPEAKTVIGEQLLSTLIEQRESVKHLQHKRNALVEKQSQRDEAHQEQLESLTTQLREKENELADAINEKEAVELSLSKQHKREQIDLLITIFNSSGFLWDHGQSTEQNTVMLAQHIRSYKREKRELSQALDDLKRRYTLLKHGKAKTPVHSPTVNNDRTSEPSWKEDDRICKACDVPLAYCRCAE